MKIALSKYPTRFSLIHLSFQRIKQLRAGAAPLVQSKNKEVVVALREIAARKVSFPIEKELSPGISEKVTDSEEKGETINLIKRRRSR